MKFNNSYIYLENVTFYSYHGLAQQERKVGNTFVINLRLKVDVSRAMNSDHVDDTVNYATVYEVLAEEMSIPSNLLEHVCGRIADKIFGRFASVEEIVIRLSKRNPPMGADIDYAGVELSCTRE